MANLLQRHWRAIASADSAVRVMQWNVLADQLTYNFQKVTEEVLGWTYRRPRIVEEVRRAHADVVCLEEVDHFEELQRELSEYEGVFRKKEDWHDDGTAVFVRSSAVTLEEWRGGTFAGKRQVFLLAVLRLKSTGVRFVLVATHLKSERKCEHYRVQQVEQLLSLVAAYSPLPVVIAGDMNALPDQAVYSLFLSSGFLSAYGIPAFTTYTYRGSLRKEVIDYIWLRGFRATGLLAIPTEEEIGQFGLPSEQYPSDHVSLVADLSLDS